jgi:polyisoprenoid-binding protein YceI
VEASALPVTGLRVRPDSRLWLEGSSNVRDWTCRATELDATFDLDRSGGAASLRSVSVRVPVRTLKCGDRHMEAHMYTALKAPPAPEMSFITARFDKLPAISRAGDQIETSGQLTIAGVERTVRMSAVSEQLPDGSYRARGTVPILMTDFGITPPRPWRGILRTADRVLIQFEIFIAPVT